MEPFWSDDFDMDLLQVFPTLPRMIETAATPIWTVGSTTLGRLNHPSIWNSHGAFIWLREPDLQRDARGWFNIQGCVADSPLVECTWLEDLRDAWPHQYASVILPTKRMIPPPPVAAFDAIMWDLRGWRKYGLIEVHRTNALRWVLRADQILRAALAVSEQNVIDGGSHDVDVQTPSGD